MLTPLRVPGDEPMPVAGFMSDAGGNLTEIIKYELALKEHRKKPPYRLAVIFSDKNASNARKIGEEFDRPFIYNDVFDFYRARGKKISDPAVREEFDRATLQLLKPYNCAVAAMAGYMRIVTDPLLDAYLCINVHPADLSIVDEKGQRKYTGDKAVRLALLDDQRTLCSSTIILESCTTNGKFDKGKMDNGKILMISPPMPVTCRPELYRADEETIDSVANEQQGLLKRAGDFVIFPRTLQYIAEGRYQKDDKGDLYFEGSPIPNGLKL